MKVTLTRFGRKRRLVLMLEWLTVWPTWGPLAVNSQPRDMVKSSIFPNDVRPPFGAPRANSLSLQGAGGRIGGKRRDVKVLGRVSCSKVGVIARQSVSSPAKAGDPVFRESAARVEGARRTGCPAFAGHDSKT